MKRIILSLLAIASACVLFGDDAPHWIGLDTTLRDAQPWVAPVSASFAQSLDTRIMSYEVSESGRITGRPLQGFLVFVK